MGCSRVGGLVTRTAVSWQWGNVDATEEGRDVYLTHRPTNATLRVCGGRLRRDAGYGDATPVVRRELARVGAIIRLRQRGRYYLHASAAVDTHGRAFVLAGNSGTGKSTLAFALAKSGWSILGDDGVIVDAERGEIVAHAWRGPLMVSAALTGPFRELAGHGVHAMKGDSRQRIPISAAQANRGRVSALLFLERSPVFAITRLGPRDCLAALIRQSPWVILGDGESRRHLDTLRRMAAIPAFHLRHTAAEVGRMGEILAEALS